MGNLQALESVINNTGVRERVCSLFIMAPPPKKTLDNKDVVRAWISLNQGTGQITYFSLVADLKEVPRGDTKALESPDEVYRLAKEYGGSKHLRIGLENGLKRYGSDSKIFDSEFFNWQNGGEWLGRNRPHFTRDEEKPYEMRDILIPIFELFNIDYTLNAERKELFPQKLQRRMHCTPEKVKKAYERLLETGHIPSIANGAGQSGFHLFQHLSWDAQRISKSIHLSSGSILLPGEEIPGGSLELIAMTLNRYGIYLDETWSFSGNRYEHVKNSRRKNQLKGYLPDEVVWEEGYRGQVRSLCGNPAP